MSLSITSCTPKIDADTVVYGKIFTSEKQDSIVEAFAVKDGKYVYVGSKENVYMQSDDLQNLKKGLINRKAPLWSLFLFMMSVA